MSQMAREGEIRDVRIKFVLDIAPLEIIDKEGDEDFINAAVKDINQIDLVIHIIDHRFIYQYWSLISGDSIIQSSPCHHQHHRDRHHLCDDDDEEMILITCEPLYPPEVRDKLLVDQGVFANYVVNDVDSANKDHAAAADDDDYIMSLLHDMDALYEYGRFHTYKNLEEVKRCITQRISEAKPAVLLARPKRVRVRVHLSSIIKRYYANTAAVQFAIKSNEIAELCIYCPPPQRKSPAPQLHEMKRASRASEEALETKVFEKGDLISSSSSSSCPVCLIEYRVGVDVIKKMPCSHMFHVSCLLDWLVQRNTCPLCRYELPTRQLASSRWNCLPAKQLSYPLAP